RIARAHRACLNSLLQNALILPVTVNTRLPPAQTQFCLRSFLEGRCDSIRIISPPDSLRDHSPLLRSMRLEIRQREQLTRASKDSCGICRDYRELMLVAFEKSGELVEAVAFDPTSRGFSQIAAVWPGQIADFFSRHAPIHVRELFTETMYSWPLPGTS